MKSWFSHKPTHNTNANTNTPKASQVTNPFTPTQSLSPDKDDEGKQHKKEYQLTTPSILQEIMMMNSNAASHKFGRTLINFEFLEQIAVYQSTRHLRNLEEFLASPAPHTSKSHKKTKFVSTNGIPQLGFEDFIQIFFGYYEGEEIEQKGEWHPGLLALPTYPHLQDQRIISLVDEIVDTLLCKGYFNTILSFRNYDNLEKGRCGLISEEVLNLVTGEKGLLEIISYGSWNVLLMLYYFLSVDYEGASSIWRALSLLPDFEIRNLCKALVTQYLTPSAAKMKEKSPFHIIKQKEDFVYSFAHTLFFRLMEWKGWLTPTPNSSSVPDHSFQHNTNNNSSGSGSGGGGGGSGDDILHSYIEQFNFEMQSSFLSSTKVTPSLFILSEITEKDRECHVTTAQTGLLQQTELLAERLSKLEQTLNSIQHRNEYLEKELKTKYADGHHEHKEKHKGKHSFKLYTKSSHKDESHSHSHTPVTHISNSLFIGDVGYGNEWSGVGHINCSKTISKDFALLQKNDGKYTIINKAPGPGYISLSVGNEPKVIMDQDGNLGVGTLTPKSKLHVEGPIRCGSSSFGALSPENLVVIRGGFSGRTLEPRNTPGYVVEAFDNGVFEVRFTEPFAKRPSVFAIQHFHQSPPSLIAIGYVDTTKFGFYELSGKVEVWVEFVVMGPKQFNSEEL